MTPLRYPCDTLHASKKEAIKSMEINIKLSPGDKQKEQTIFYQFVCQTKGDNHFSHKSRRENIWNKNFPHKEGGEQTFSTQRGGGQKFYREDDDDKFRELELFESQVNL